MATSPARIISVVEPEPVSRWRFPWPMALTLLRLAMLPSVLWLLWSLPGVGGVYSAAREHRRWLIVALLAVMAVSDILDGSLARRLNQVSLWGTILDPIADKLLISASLLFLCLPRFSSGAEFFIPPAVTAGVYAKDFGVTLGAIVIRKQLHRVTIRSRLFGKSSTFVQLALILATLLGPEFVRFSPTLAAGLVWTLWWAVIATATAASLDYARQGALQLRTAKATATARSTPPTFN